MALKKMSLELPMTGGVDTKTDSKQVRVGKLLSAKNMVYTNPGEIQKREGFNSIGNTVLDDGSTITDGQGILVKGDELLICDKDNIYSYVDGLDKWKDKGDYQSTYVTNASVTNGTAYDHSCAVAYDPSTNSELYLFMRLSGGAQKLYYQVHDRDTKQIVVGPVEITTAGTEAFSPCALFYQGSFVMYFYHKTDLVVYKGSLPANTPTAAVGFGALTLLTPFSTQKINSSLPVFHAKRIDDPNSASKYICFVYNNAFGGPGNNITIQLFTNTGSAPAYSATFNNINDEYGLQFDICWEYGISGPQVAYSGVVATPKPYFYIHRFNISLTVEQKGSILIDTPYAAPSLASPVESHWVTVQSKNTGVSDSIVRVIVSWKFPTGASPAFDQLGSTSITTSWNSILVLPNPITPTTKWTLQQVSLVSRGFIYSDSFNAFFTGGPRYSSAGISTAEHTHFVIGDSGKPMARFSMDSSGQLTYDPILTYLVLPEVCSPTSTTFFAPLTVISSYAQVSGSTQTAIQTFTVDFFNTEKSYQSSNITNSLYLGGGLLYQYDGLNLVEDAYNWQAYIQSMTRNGTAGTTNEYKYVAVWEWVDNNGYTHRGVPSDPYTITSTQEFDGTVSGLYVSDILLMPLGMTEKAPENARTPVQCVLYRTKKNDDTGYFKVPTTVANNNDIDALFITPADDFTKDDNLGVALYANVQPPNETPPPTGALTTYKNRLWAIDSTNPNVLWFSKVCDNVNPVEWSSVQTVTLDPEGGAITGIQAMDDKLIVFKERSLRFISGNGPDPTLGALSDYSESLITTDAGCVNLRSIVLFPEGVLFKSKKGIYLLNRGLQVSYIGAPVEQWNSDFITSGLLMADKNQIRFTTDADLILVYDYFIENWCTFEPLSAVDSVVFNDVHTFIKSNGTVVVETPGVYTDDTVAYPMEFMTNWFQFGGVQGYQRFWAAQVLGEFKSAHELAFDLYYNYSENVQETITVLPTAPSGNEIYQYEIRPSFQKCQSFKMKIYDTDTTGESYALSNVRLSYGIIGGRNRLTESQTFGG